MPHIFTNAEYADMMYVCGFCDGSATAAVLEYHRWFPMDRIPGRSVFYKVFDTLCECSTLPSAHVSWAYKKNMEEQENILDMVQLSPTIITQRLSARIGVSRTRVWQTLHEDDLFPFHPQPVQNLHPGDSAMRLEFCHWLHTNHQLLPLKLLTDEATFTHNGINNTHNCHQWPHANPHGTVETNFQRRLSIMCGAV